MKIYIEQSTILVCQLTSASGETDLRRFQHNFLYNH